MAPPPRFLANHPDEALLIHRVAEAYHVRPSAILRGDWDDYQLDMAVLVTALDEQARREKAPKSRMPTGKTFASPLGLAKHAGGIKTMQIPESGVW